MKKFVLPAIAISVSLFALALFATSGTCSQPPTHPTGPKADTYMVIKVTDENKADKKVEYKAISSSQYKDEEERVKKDNDKNLKEWKDKIKDEPSTPRPKRILIKKIKTGYQTQKVAQDKADKLRDEEAGKDDEKPKDTKK